MVKNLPAEAGDIGLLQKILRRWAWELIPVFLPGKSHGQSNLAGFTTWGGKESDTAEQGNAYMGRSIYR